MGSDNRRQWTAEEKLLERRSATQQHTGVREMLYAGVDAHKATSYVTVLDEAGTVVRRLKVASSQDGMRTALRDLPGPVKAVVEASYTWGPIYDWLDEIADEVILAHPAKGLPKNNI